MELNYKLIIFASLAQFILGALWYSPLMFGKWWMEIMESTTLSAEELKKLQKEMAPFYGLQLLITVIFTYVLAMFIHYLSMAGVSIRPYSFAGLVWLGFIVPTQIAGVIWGNTKRKFWLKQIFIMTGFQLVSLIIAADLLFMPYGYESGI